MQAKRRIVSVVAIGVVISGLFVRSANAVCIAQPLHDVLETSGTVWWATVTDAAAAPQRSPGTWMLTVRLDDVLKGEGAPGGTATVFISSCGPVITPAGAEHAAASFVGVQRLFFVSHARGTAIAYSDIVKPQRTQRQQYEAALDDLGLSRVGPEPTNSPSDGAWPLFAGAGAIVLMGAVILFLVLRRKARAT
jgi:hypothetical protein